MTDKHAAERGKLKVAQLNERITRQQTTIDQQAEEIRRLRCAVSVDDTQEIPISDLLDMDMPGIWDIVHGRIDQDCARLGLMPGECERIWREAIEHYESVSAIGKNG